MTQGYSRSAGQDDLAPGVLPRPAGACRLLVVEDNPGDFTLIRHHLAEEAGAFHLIRAETLEQALDLLGHMEFDAVLLDVSLPDSRGLDTISTVVGWQAGPAVVVLTGSDDEGLALGAIQSGAQDYVVKGQATGATLRRIIRCAIARKRLFEERRRILITAGSDPEQQARQRAEQALREERDFTRAVLETASALVVVLDPDGRVVHFNQACERLTGFHLSDVRGRVLWDLVLAGETQLRTHEAFAGLKRGDIPSEFENEWVGFDGARHPIRWNNAIFHNPDGSVRYMIAVGIDITLRRRAEQALQQAHAELEQRVERRTLALQMEVQHRSRTEEILRQSEARIRLVADAIPGLLAYIDAEQRFQFANRRHGEWFGREPEGIVGLPMAEVLGRHFMSQARPYMEAVLDGREVNFEAILELPDGRMPSCQAVFVPHRSEDGWVMGFFFLIQDITERRRAEEDLRRSEEKYRALLARAADAIVLTDPDGRILEANRKAEELFGLPASRLKEMSATQLMVEADHPRVLDAFRQLWEMGECQVDALAILTAGGQTVPVDVSASAVVIGGRRFFQAIFKDISAHKRAEEQLRSAKEAAELADRAKSEFLANMSHELRTPLNAIIGFSDIMRNELMGPLGASSYREYVHDIHESGRHLLEVINEILDMSKVESGRLELHPEPVELPDVVRASLRLISERAVTAKVSLEVDIAEGLPRILVDARRFKQILLNLLSNAVKFTPSGGRVTVGACLVEGGCFEMTVADTGIGMTAKDMDKAMAPFGQVDSALSRKYDGTGLGLPLTKSFVELHDGHLILESRPGQGTVVRVRLPPERVLCADRVMQLRSADAIS